MRRQAGNLNAAEIGLTFDYIRNLREREVAQVVLISNREKSLDVKREELLEAVKKRKIMEILKQKKLEQDWKEWNHRESVVVNEQGIIRFLKRSGDEKRLVVARRDGKEVYYKLEDEHIITLFQQGIRHVTDN